MKKTWIKFATAVVALGFTATVHAIPSQGSIDIGAFVSHLTIDKAANTVTFVDDDANPGNAIVNNATGDFATFLLDIATYANFTYDPLALTNPLWQLVSGDASFDLNAITSIDEAGTGLVLTGTGVIHVNGFDDTTGVWSFSADQAGTANFTFSSQTTTVPDGGATLMLLGAALSGLGLLRRKVTA